MILYDMWKNIEGDASRRMRLVGHVARLVARRVAYRVWWGNLPERHHLKNRRLGGRVNRIFSRFGGCGLD